MKPLGMILMKAPQFRELKVADLKTAHYNPKTRIKPDRIRVLVNSIGKIGLLYPILVTPDNVVIDGHRRLAAYIELGYETIPAIVGIGDPNELYSSVNDCSRRMGGNEALQVWLAEPKAVKPILQSRFELLVEVLGMARVKRLAKEGMSIKVYTRAKQLCTYCDQDGSTVPEFFDWIMNTQSIGGALEAIRSEVPATTIVRAMKSDKPLRMKAVVGD